MPWLSTFILGLLDLIDKVMKMRKYERQFSDKTRRWPPPSVLSTNLRDVAMQWFESDDIDVVKGLRSCDIRSPSEEYVVAKIP